jgi:hypothetical protein
VCRVSQKYWKRRMVREPCVWALQGSYLHVRCNVPFQSGSATLHEKLAQLIASTPVGEMLGVLACMSHSNAWTTGYKDAIMVISLRVSCASSFTYTHRKRASSYAWAWRRTLLSGRPM